MKANIQIDLKIVYEKSSDGYTAYFPDLELYGMGDNKLEAKKSLKQSLDITIDYCLKNGTLFEVMEKAGFNKSIRLPKATQTKSYEKLNYNIPLNNYGKEKRQYA
jgi:hypothetical protein